MFFLSFMCSSHASYLCHFCLCDKWERESPYWSATWKVNCPLKELLIFSNIDLCVSFTLWRENKTGLQIFHLVLVLTMLHVITSILGCRTQYQSCLHVRQGVFSFSLLSLDWNVPLPPFFFTPAVVRWESSYSHDSCTRTESQTFRN